MKRRFDRDMCMPPPPSEAFVRGATGTYLHTWGDGTTGVVGVILLAPPLSGVVPCLVQPHDGGDFHLCIDVHSIVPLSIDRMGGHT
jgi:hypothetical protein